MRDPYSTANTSLLPALLATVITLSYLVQNLVQVIDDLVTENAELQQQLTRAEETVRREQQQMTQLVHKHVRGSGFYTGFFGGRGGKKLGGTAT